VTYSAEVLADSPRWYLRLGESSGTVAEDATANNLDGTYIGSPTLAQTGLVADDTSVLFDSVDDYVRVLDATHPTAYTLEAIVKPSTTANQAILWRTDTGEGSSLSHYIGIKTGVFFHYTYDGANNTVTGTTPVVGGTVYHVAATAVNGGAGKLFVNGIEEGTPLAGLGTLWTGGNRYVIGKSSPISGPPGNPDWFEGVIDEVALYTSALSSARIAAHFTAFLDAPPSGIAAVAAAAASASSLGTSIDPPPPSYLALAGSVDYADLRTD
jgi:hypothetical protein